MINYGKQDINDSDINAVVDVLKSDFLTQGPVVQKFEQEIATYCQAKYAAAMTNATACLHLACLALGVNEHDIVWTSPISFVASSNCALYCGAAIDFVDIDLATGLMSVQALAKKLQDAERSNSLPKVIIPVHLGGQSCDMQGISALANRYDIKIIEDASHAIGATYQDKPVGCCLYSDISVFSFHPVKIITSAEGGIATTNQPELAEKLKQLSNHGITKEPSKYTELHHGSWYYQQQSLGFNCRMSELHAALGHSQLSRLEEFIEKRNSLAANYQSLLEALPVTTLQQHTYGTSSYHLFVIQLDNANIHPYVFEALKAKGIGVNLHYIPIHLQPYYQSMGFNSGDFPQAENYYSRAISLPLHPNLTEQEQEYIVLSLTLLINEYQMKA